MTVKNIISSIVFSAFALTAAAQCPPPDAQQGPCDGPKPPCPKMKQECPVSFEARMKIKEIIKADREKQRAKMETMRKLVEAYKADKSEANKAKIMEQIGKCFDERIAAKEAALAKEKASKAEFTEKAFDAIISGKPLPCQQGKYGRHHAKKGPQGFKENCPGKDFKHAPGPRPEPPCGMDK